MPVYHKYKNKPGGYWRGYSPWTGRYYTYKEAGSFKDLVKGLLFVVVPIALCALDILLLELCFEVIAIAKEVPAQLVSILMHLIRR